MTVPGHKFDRHGPNAVLAALHAERKGDDPLQAVREVLGKDGAGVEVSWADGTRNTIHIRVDASNREFVDLMLVLH